MTKGLGQVGIGHPIVVSALLQSLRGNTRLAAVESLGRLEIRNEVLLRKVLVALNRCMYDQRVRKAALIAMRQLLDSRPLPGYRWVPLRERQAQRLHLKRIAFWFGVATVIVVIGLATTWLLGILAPNSFIVRFLAILVATIGFVAAVAQALGRTLRDPWELS